MGKITQVNNGDTGLQARTKINEAIKAVETDSSIDGDGNIGTPLKISPTVGVTRRRGNLSVVTNNIEIDCENKNEFKSTNILDVSANATIDIINSSGNEFGTFFVNITNLATLTFLPLPSEDFISIDGNWSPNTWTPSENGIFSIGWERVIDGGTTYYNLLFSPKASV